MWITELLTKVVNTIGQVVVVITTVVELGAGDIPIEVGLLRELLDEENVKGGTPTELRLLKDPPDEWLVGGGTCVEVGKLEEMLNE